jgi:hypothetical protein
MTTPVLAAIASIPAHAWTPITYPHAVWDEQEQRWIWRRRGRRDQLHRVQLPPHTRSRRVPAGGAPGETAPTTRAG